jgi:hypothetical protein
MLLSERVGTAAAAVVSVGTNNRIEALRVVCSATEYESAYAIELVGLIAAMLSSEVDATEKEIFSDCASALRAVVRTDYVKPGGSFYLKLLAQRLTNSRLLKFGKVKAHPERIKGLHKRNWDDNQKGIFYADQVAGPKYLDLNVGSTCVKTIDDTGIRRLAASAAEYFITANGELPIVADIRSFEDRSLEELYKSERTESSRTTWEIMSNRMCAQLYSRYKRSYWERAVRMMWKLHLTGSQALRFGIKLDDYNCPMCHRDIDDFKHIYDTCSDLGIVEIRKQYDDKLQKFFADAISGDKYRSSIWHIRNVRSNLQKGRSTWWAGMFNQEMVDMLCANSSDSPASDYKLIKDALAITTRGLVSMYKYYKQRTDEVGRWKKSNRAKGSAELLASWLVRDANEVAKAVQNAVTDDAAVDEEKIEIDVPVLKELPLKLLRTCATEGCRRYVANVYAKVVMPEGVIEGEYCHNDDFVDDMYCVFCMRVYDDGLYSGGQDAEPTGREGIG